MMIHRYFVYLFIFIIFQTEYVPSRRQGFLCKDPSLTQVYTSDTVKPKLLIYATVFGSLFFVALIELIAKGSFKQLDLSYVWAKYVDFNTSALVVMLITDFLKVTVGEHRPHFLSDCRPYENENCAHGSYIDEFTCSNTEWSGLSIRDLSKSFPSGHSSLSVFTALYFINLVRQRLRNSNQVIKTLLVALFLSWTLVCALSRIVDKKHHWWDVAGGLCIGILYATYKIRSIRNEVKESHVD